MNSISRDALTKAFSGGIMYQTILQDLEAAYKASNPASALGRLRTAKYDADDLKRRIDAAVAQLERDVRDDENAAERDFVAALEFGTRPKLRVVG